MRGEKHAIVATTRRQNIQDHRTKSEALAESAAEIALQRTIERMSEMERMSAETTENSKRKNRTLIFLEDEDKRTYTSTQSSQQTPTCYTRPQQPSNQGQPPTTTIGYQGNQTNPGTYNHDQQSIPFIRRSNQSQTSNSIVTSRTETHTPQ